MLSTKQALTTGPGIIESTQLDTREPANDEVRVAVEQVGICGSDLHIFSGHHPTATFPRVQGHEVSAVLEAFPNGYHGDLKAGTRVAIDPLISCGTCYACRIGRTNACRSIQVIGAHRDGFLQTRLVVPAGNVYPAGDLSADQVVLAEPLSVGIQAVERAAIQPGETVAIIGAGPIGLCCAVAAIARGARVLIADTVAARLQAAKDIGIEEAVDVTDADLTESVTEWTEGDGPAVTIDAVGSPSVIQTCFALVAPAGRVVIVGISDKPVSLPIIDFSYKELTVLGSRASTRRFPAALDLLRSRPDLPTVMISHRFSLDDTKGALDLATNSPSETLKVIVEVA